MSDRPQLPGWWMASDGNWYPPESHPDFRAQAAPPPPSAAPAAAKGSSFSRGVGTGVGLGCGLVIFVVLALVVLTLIGAVLVAGTGDAQSLGV